MANFRKVLMKKSSTIKFIMKISFLLLICIHRSILLIFIEKKSMLINFFPKENILFRDWFSFPRESSFLRRVPESDRRALHPPTHLQCPGWQPGSGRYPYGEKGQWCSCWVSVPCCWRAGWPACPRTTPERSPAGCCSGSLPLLTEIHMKRAALTHTQNGRDFFVGCLTSQKHASVSQGRICTDNFTCCHTVKEVADQTFHLTQSQYTDTGLTSPSTDPIMPGAWQGSHWSANF